MGEHIFRGKEYELKGGRYILSGREYEFRGEYRAPQMGEYFLNSSGHVGQAAGAFTMDRAIVYPVPIFKTIGGITFRDTEVKRRIKRNEWYVSRYGLVTCAKGLTEQEYNVLELVGVAGKRSG